MIELQIWSYSLWLRNISGFPEHEYTRDGNVFIFLDFSFRVHQKYKRYVAQYDILWHRVNVT